MSASNRLGKESSPYLLQHALNPVDWYPWGKEALDKALRENKLLLISVGYSSCHWCHVMEHESFEDEEVVRVMNAHFVCIKVDREERPDVDQVYMNAIQLMNGQGGWPLNCFALPDGRPVYGGTYFPKEAWLSVLHQLALLYRNENEKVVEYAAKLTQGIQLSELVTPPDTPVKFSRDTLAQLVARWKKQFDLLEGGPNRAPKFPMPHNYLFLLRYGTLQNDQALLDYVKLTLDKMALGGIFDQAGGGFARYSTDMIWKVPHFEKMLYDNAQLLSLYSEAYAASGRTLYRETAFRIAAFLEKELAHKDGGFYAALDADTEGEEGKFYTWSKEELQGILGEEYPLASAYYQVNQLGEWEGRYILLRRETDEIFAREHDINLEELRARIEAINRKLYAAREKRERPGLDDKVITSWNALAIQGYCDAFKAFGEDRFREQALRTARFILGELLRSDGGLWHRWCKGEAGINGFLEDYSFTIEAFLSLYEITFDEAWLKWAQKFADYAYAHFYDPASGLFFFTSSIDAPLVARKTEFTDNVTPASNSSLAKGLWLLAQHTGETRYADFATAMLSAVYAQLPSYGAGFSYWALLHLHLSWPFYEIAVCGPQALELAHELMPHYHPNRLWAGSTTESRLPLLTSRFKTDETLIYVCREKTCNLPVGSAAEAAAQLL